MKHLRSDSFRGKKSYYGGKSSFMKRKMSKARRRMDRKTVITNTLQ